MGKSRCNPMTPTTDLQALLAEATDGPWKWIKDDRLMSLSPGVLLADEADGTPWGDGVDRANARLIAMAPDLAKEVVRLRELVEWQPIETAPKNGKLLIGYDEISAAAFNDRSAGLCLITWLDDDDDEGWPAEWQVQPFCEGMDCVESEVNLTHWRHLPTPPKEGE